MRVVDEEMVPLSVLVVYHCSDEDDPERGFGETDHEDPSSYQYPVADVVRVCGVDVPNCVAVYDGAEYPLPAGVPVIE